MSGIEIRLATAEDALAWDSYVAGAGSFFHRYGWAEAIRETYGHEPVYLLAERGGEVAGILPLIDRRSSLFGRALISVGFTVGGGVVAEDNETRAALLTRALAEAKARSSEYIELRSEDDAEEGWHEKEGIYDTFSVGIIEDEEQRLKSIRRKKRADIRKAIDWAADGELTIQPSDDLKRFWKGYAIAQRDHGTPVFPRRWLEAQKARFGDDMELIFVEQAGEPLAGVINYYHRDTVHLYSSFISPGARRSHAGDYLYWWMMGHALTRGARIFDLGRSKRGTGAHAYKTHWGFEPRALSYMYKLMQTDEMPNVNPQNPKFALMSKVWTRLPVPVANRLGPMLAGHLA
ncbi:FemAB family XrtA/PEP-CTERM system-associated protein [Parvularcula marina]|uniref:FemAB family XrtA/PEP-CTERM system-associated protein n=1 Tax=Parvularcula marina TaxID=2292771 RepID=UPI0035167126